MYLSLILLPLINFFTLSVLGRFLGRFGALVFSFFFMFITLLTSITCFYEVSLSGAVCVVELFNWFSTDYFEVKWHFFFDTLTCVMAIVIVFISFLVHVYSFDYMSSDPYLSRFLSYLSLFTFFMLMLVTSSNFFQLFLGWEGVGIVSFLLINFWFTRLQAGKSALKAMFLNRVGDIGLLLGLFLIYKIFNSLDFAVIFLTLNFFYNKTIFFIISNVHALTLISIFLFIGVAGKSAQVGLHVWLPDAMEGPTPVSALLHAATMVTAGIFLMVRGSFLFENTVNLLPFITIVGALTAFIASTIGILQYDIKKVVAYSTCSQLGYMIFSCGLSNYSLSMFHLFNHAFFKALLFLSMGSIIHSMFDEQDMRKMGGLINLLPFSYVMTLVGVLSLVGFPFMTGFYSKDFILEVAYANLNFYAFFSYFLGLFSAFFTSTYSFRLLFLIFLTRTNSFRKIIGRIFDSTLYIYIVNITLSFFSIFIGYLAKDMFIGFGNFFWGNSLLVKFENLYFVEGENISILVKLFPLIIVLFGFLFSYAYNLEFSYELLKLKLDKFYYKYFYLFLNRLWFFDLVYNNIIVRRFLDFSYLLPFKLIDKGLLEFNFSFFLERLSKLLFKVFTRTQSGYLYDYLFLIFFNLVIFLYLIMFDYLLI